MEYRVESSASTSDYGDSREREEDELDDDDDDKEEEEEVVVMSEVHIGCPPGMSGSHISRFTISIPPGNSYPAPLAVIIVFVFRQLVGWPEVCDVI